MTNFKPRTDSSTKEVVTKKLSYFILLDLLIPLGKILGYFGLVKKKKKKKTVFIAMVVLHG